jgi:bifunctional UDP-N-acetylglucosamine pyrophosphorylase/glucosamine-1-phosphate N-acetyltransferase
MGKKMAVILAAGKGTRMKSKKPKVLHEVCGQSMLEYVIDSCRNVGTDEIHVIVGYESQLIKDAVPEGNGLSYTMQEEQLGTGHALMQVMPEIQKFRGQVMVLVGDAPLITSGTLEHLLEINSQEAVKATVITAEIPKPKNYGRIIRDEKGYLQKIVEAKDAKPHEKAVKEINSGMYCFDAQTLASVLDKLDNNNAQKEYYLTDVIGLIRGNGHKVKACLVENQEDILAVNSKTELATISKIMRRRINTRLMEEGVIITDPESTYIDYSAKVGQDTEIEPGVILKGDTVIGDECLIGSSSKLVNAIVGDRVTVEHSIILKSSVGDDTKVGPYAYIRPDSHIGRRVKIGDFVEVKKSIIGDDTKASHLTYIGDAKVGEGVNLGCGVVFVNYDGKNKYLTEVEDHAFIGCNTNLVAPVKVGKNVYVAAGSTITEDVPENALAIARCRQTIKEEYVTNNNLMKK